MSNQIKFDKNFTIAGLDNQVIVSGAGWAGNQQLDLATIADGGALTVVITGTIADGVNMLAPLNMPRGSILSYYFTNPGTNTIGFTGYRQFTILPAWQTGKDAYYQVKRIAIDNTPANDIYLLSGNLQGGSASETPEASYTIPAAGSEISVGVIGADTIFRSRWTGNLAATQLVNIGGPPTGSFKQIMRYGGEINPQNSQLFPLPFAHPDSTPWAAALQKHTDGNLRWILGTSLQNATYTYDLWADYSKI